MYKYKGKLVLNNVIESMIVTENVAPRHRAWMGIAFNCSYPVGMLYLAAAATLLKDWRDLQLALTVPASMLVVIF